MPELPEVEITLRGIAPHIVGRKVQRVEVRQPRLRWPVPPSLCKQLPGQRIEQISRRAKYLLIKAGSGTVIIHLGMSGSLRLLRADTRPAPHDHFDMIFDNDACLRLRDPRRFGCVLWTLADPREHHLLRTLGPEPLSHQFDGDYLHRLSRGRMSTVKAFIMNAKIVAGIGNIYACEALFRSRIHPSRQAGRISKARYQRLVACIKSTLGDALRAGGTTLRDFTHSDGTPGYFGHTLQVYGRAGEPCTECGQPIRRQIRNQRSSFLCPHCQR
ncbi:MAG: bifunctional DNA-formamidopyrimidine glycosylase/DNA-(apurinic or apyrimidinic site) lyase [Gammaproteobacteria bacterium]|nr:bifunctional DNA-formamidopyrimidine glycosylase/DNA-(apurinic or apyrimidinic site) lyase [Gammaproteobacteria bacterium]